MNIDHNFLLATTHCLQQWWNVCKWSTLQGIFSPNIVIWWLFKIN